MENSCCYIATVSNRNTHRGLIANILQTLLSDRRRENRGRIRFARCGRALHTSYQELRL